MLKEYFLYKPRTLKTLSWNHDLISNPFPNFSQNNTIGAPPKNKQSRC